MDLHLANRLKIPHTFVVQTYTRPTKCQLCNKMLVGVFKQGLQCKDCRYNVHKKCSELTPRDCTGDIRLELEVKSANHPPVLIRALTQLPAATELGDREGEEGGEGESREWESDIVTPENFGSHLLVEQSQSNIPVQRLVQSVRHTRRRNVSGPLKEGWVVHFTNKESARRRDYWRLDSKCLTLWRVRRLQDSHRVSSCISGGDRKQLL